MVRSAAAALACTAPRSFAQASPGDETVIRTASGRLRGQVQKGVRVFRGVSFAEPPVGELRFRPPVVKRAWTGVLDATRFGASPMQSGEPGIEHSEDCLTLNLWAPEGRGPFPVFVWIHGGGFTGGHAFEPIYDGAEFARAGIVCISVAYRLGVLGFLDVSALLDETYAGSANNGLSDLLMALQWVQRHVADFGGDPGRVTVGGESAGAKLTDLLMGIPAAQGLFHQMISESGGAERIWPVESAKAVAAGFGKKWKEATGLGVSALLTEPADRIIPVQKGFIESWPTHFPLRSELDAKLFPRLPVETIASGSTRGKRLLIGTNRDESALFVGPRPEHDATASDLGNMSVAGFDEVYPRYASAYPGMNAYERRIRALTAEEYWIPSVRVADAHVRGGGKAWMYELTFGETSGRWSGYAYHSLDVGLVWGKPHLEVKNASAEAALATQVHAAWAAFVRGEAPAAAGLPTWPEYDATRRATMMLDGTSRVEQKPQEPELRLWDTRL